MSLLLPKLIAVRVEKSSLYEYEDLSKCSKDKSKLREKVLKHKDSSDREKMLNKVKSQNVIESDP